MIKEKSTNKLTSQKTVKYPLKFYMKNSGFCCQKFIARKIMK